MLTHLDVLLRPDPSRTVVRPFSPEYPEAFAVPGHPRAQMIVDRVLALDHDAMCVEFSRVTESLDERHRDVDAMLLRRFDEVAKGLHDPDALNEDQRKLVGAYFSEEYSFEAAALFNPSAVARPDQSAAPEGGVSFLLALRGIGEGHVSSVTFRTGTWVPGGPLVVDKASVTAVPPVISDPNDNNTGAPVHLQCGASREPSETVLFPVLPSQRRGVEDVRLVRFTNDDGTVSYYGTYTAFDGVDARSELLTGRDFRSFEMRALEGKAAQTKGMALFPRKIDGQYVMLGRQDSESIWLLRSDDLYRWEDGQKLVSPRYPWEFVQMGNCGSPIELDEGWLVLTHGVGTVRTYCMGACLLDKADPSQAPRPHAEAHPGAKPRRARRLCAKRRLQLRRAAARTPAIDPLRRGR